MHQNTISTEPEPSFEENLYTVMKFLHPSLTNRVFSTACLSRSPSYWSSVMGQKIRLANTALIDLTDYLESQKIVHQYNDAKVQIINDIQQMIADEIVDRFKSLNQESIDGWDRISKALREQTTEEKYGYYGMPFISTSYGY